MLFIILNLKQMRSLAEEAAESKDWTYTAVKDGEACWSKLKMFSAAADCTGAEATAVADPPAGTGA